MEVGRRGALRQGTCLKDPLIRFSSTRTFVAGGWWWGWPIPFGSRASPCGGKPGRWVGPGLLWGGAGPNLLAAPHAHIQPSNYGVPLLRRRQGLRPPWISSRNVPLAGCSPRGVSRGTTTTTIAFPTFLSVHGFQARSGRPVGRDDPGAGAAGSWPGTSCGWDPGADRGQDRAAERLSPACRWPGLDRCASSWRRHCPSGRFALCFWDGTSVRAHRAGWLSHVHVALAPRRWLTCSRAPGELGIGRRLRHRFCWRSTTSNRGACGWWTRSSRPGWA